MKNRLITTYEKTHKQMIKIIRNSKKYCFLFAFYFDWHYNKDIQAEVINALDRGVSIYINLSEVSENNICYIHPNLHIRQSQLYKEGDSPVFDIASKLITNGSKLNKTVVHTRFIYNGETLLLGGTNVNHRYNGNLNQRDRKSDEDDEFYWYDGGYLTHDYPDQFDFFRNIFLYKDTNKHIRNLSLNNTLLLSNEAQHTFLCEQIRNAKHTIYIECQYFHTNPQYLSNRIGHELVTRVKKAMDKNEHFTLTILTNTLNHDERTIKYMSSALTFGCLVAFRNMFDCDDDTFAKYVICKMPTMESKIIIHQKYWIFDEKVALYTTGNLSDRSFYESGDFEMGIILRGDIPQPKNDFPMIIYDFKYPCNNSNDIFENYEYFTILTTCLADIIPKFSELVGQRFS
jgi:phosphatidylserine/phosphatidylglycerophosphate/cardiolipin synthase-like enzyme